MSNNRYELTFQESLEYMTDGTLHVGGEWAAGEQPT